MIRHRTKRYIIEECLFRASPGGVAPAPRFALDHLKGGCRVNVGWFDSFDEAHRAMRMEAEGITEQDIEETRPDYDP